LLLQIVHHKIKIAQHHQRIGQGRPHSVPQCRRESNCQESGSRTSKVQQQRPPNTRIRNMSSMSPSEVSCYSRSSPNWQQQQFNNVSSQSEKRNENSCANVCCQLLLSLSASPPLLLLLLPSLLAEFVLWALRRFNVILSSQMLRSRTYHLNKEQFGYITVLNVASLSSTLHHFHLYIWRSFATSLRFLLPVSLTLSLLRHPHTSKQIHTYTQLSTRAALVYATNCNAAASNCLFICRTAALAFIFVYEP